MFRTLNATRIHKTIEVLHQRVVERFPESGLSKVAAELAAVSVDVQARVAELARPRVGLRLLIGFMLLALIGSLVAIPFLIHDYGAQSVKTLTGFVQVLEPALGSAVFLGAFVLYLMTRERDRKRSRALQSLYELRSLAHVVDMHQLTKDPQTLRAARTASSPERTLDDASLKRYLDYCAEMLALISKLGALHAQDLPDHEVLQAVDAIENLCTGLSRKIWQKLVLLGGAPQI